MMSKTGPLTIGDKCPRCGTGEFVAAKLPTADEHRKAFSGEAPGLPEGYDTMHPDDRAEHGDLHTCNRCGLNTRFKTANR
jgi:ribosomal protein S27AE